MLSGMPRQLPMSSNECDDRGLVAALLAYEGHDIKKDQLRPCIVTKGLDIAATLANPGITASGNWPPIMGMALVMSGELDPAVMEPFFDGTWGLNGYETGSHVYFCWNWAAAILLLDWCKKRGAKDLQRKIEAWLTANTALLGLQCMQSSPAKIQFSKGGPRWSESQARRNEYHYQGPFCGPVGDRSSQAPHTQANHGFMAINPAIPMLAWAIGAKRSGRHPLHTNRSSWRQDWPLAMVAKVSGAKRLSEEVDPEVFGLTKDFRDDLRGLIRHPTSKGTLAKRLPNIVAAMEGYTLRQRGSLREIEITRFEGGEYLSLLSSSGNPTWGGCNVAVGRPGLTQYVFPSHHSRPGSGGFQSSTSFCRRDGERVLCRVPDDGLEEWDITEGLSTAARMELKEILASKVAWRVVVGEFGAKIVEGSSSTASPRPSKPKPQISEADLKALAAQAKELRVGARRLEQGVENLLAGQ